MYGYLGKILKSIYIIYMYVKVLLIYEIGCRNVKEVVFYMYFL